MKIGAIIPARIGSKRLLKKNIKKLNGKPLICWTVNVLLESNIFYDISVSTDSKEIIDVIRSIYSKKDVKCIKRPAKLAGDSSPLSYVLDHYLQTQSKIDWCSMFMPTFPFRKVEKIKEAYKAITTNYPWRVISITSYEDCTMDFYYPTCNGVKSFFRHQPFYASYNLPVYNMYNRHVSDKIWGKYGLSINERTYKIHLDNEECIDIDTKNDFLLADNIAKGKTIKKTAIDSFETEKWRIIKPKSVNKDAILIFADKKLVKTSKPLIVLKKAVPGLSFYRYYDGNIRNYWINHEAFQYLSDSEYLKTGNSQDCPLHYQHSSIYRFIRKLTNDNHINETDEKGIMYLSDLDCGNNKSLENDRIIFNHDLEGAGFPVNEFEIV